MKKTIWFFLALFLAAAPIAYASITVEEDAVREGEPRTLNFSTGLSGSYSGGTYTVVADPTDILTAVFEGTTADAFETTLDVVDPTADNTVKLPDASGSVVISTLTTNSLTAANSVWAASNGVVYEGATADAFETTLAAGDTTADQTATLPVFAVNYAVLGSTLTTNTIDAANSVWGVSNGIVLEGATADAFETTISPVDPTADQTISIPNNAAASALVTSSLTTNAVDAASSVTLTTNGFIAEGTTADAFETTVTFADPTADMTVTVPTTAGATGTVDLRGATVVITAGASPTLTVPLSVNFIATDTITTDNQDQTITFSSGGSIGQIASVIFTTDSGGSNDEVITFQTTLTNTTGTITLANLTAQRYVVTLQSDGTVWNEIARTAVLS